jgi:hypothetical protein
MALDKVYRACLNHAVMEPSDKTEGSSKAVGLLKSAKDLWELGAWAIAAVSTVITFVKAHGGPVQVLIEIAFIGFGCYVALFIITFPLLSIVGALEKATGRATTDAAGIVILLIGIVGGGVFVRFVLFDQSVTHDLDAIGKAFGATIGIAILVAPFIFLWYRYGSKPVKKT